MMMWEGGGRGRRGSRALGVAAVANRVATVAFLCSILWAGILISSAQKARSQAGSHPDPLTEQALRALARGLAESQADRQQALEALRRGLAERAKEFGESGGDPLGTGSIGAPVPRLWTVPVPLPQIAGIDAPSSPAPESDLDRLFAPHPLGTPSTLRRARPQRQQAALPDPRMPPPAPPPPLVPPEPSPQSPATAQPLAPTSPAPEQSLTTEQARVPEPQTVEPTTPSANAGLEFPVTPPQRPPELRPKEEADAPDEEDEKKASPSEKPKDTRPAMRKPPAPRTRAARRIEPSTTSEPDDVKDEAPARRRAAPKAIVRRPAAEPPEATGSISRGSSPRAVAHDMPSRSARRIDVPRPLRDARRQPSDISIIPLPDALRPTRPPAGSPL